MQLKKKQSIRDALAVATCTLLSGGGSQAQAVEVDVNAWELDSAVLFYSEKDRVEIVAPTATAKKATGEDEYITLRAVYDSVTGASPNGASPTNTSQTFTSPSGESTLITAAGDTPMWDFDDQRIALGVDWDRPSSRTVRDTLSVDLSSERDYFSSTLSGTRSWDLNNRLTTFSAGLGLTFDTLTPEGGVPVEMQLVATPKTSGDETKTATSVLLGITQVINRRTLMQLNYTHNETSGYLNDPYKILSVVDPSGATLEYRYEKRPDSRSSDSLYWKMVYHLPEDVIHLSYRLFNDDWGIQSHTADLTYRYELGEKSYLTPHLRYYTQSGADFYHHSVVDGSLPTYASSDSRLADMDSITIGIKYGQKIGKDSEFSVRIENMVQTGDSHPSDAIGLQTSLDLYPDLEANSITFTYSTKL